MLTCENANMLRFKNAEMLKCKNANMFIFAFKQACPAARTESLFSLVHYGIDSMFT